MCTHAISYCPVPNCKTNIYCYPKKKPFIESLAANPGSKVDYIYGKCSSEATNLMLPRSWEGWDRGCQGVSRWWLGEMGGEMERGKEGWKRENERTSQTRHHQAGPSVRMALSRSLDVAVKLSSINPKMLLTADGFNPPKKATAIATNPEMQTKITTSIGINCKQPQMAWISTDINLKTSSIPKCHQLQKASTPKRHQIKLASTSEQHWLQKASLPKRHQP